MSKRIPDRWLNFTSIGERIDGTRFIAFKVPLNQHINKDVERNDRFDGIMLLEKVPNLGIIIDLTNTNRYYNPSYFQKKGIEYAKLMIPGRVTPAQNFVNKFKTFVRTFMENNGDNDKLIGVHCTHGVNRTGFLICNYMISEMSVEPNDAISKFALARGHEIERNNYLEALHQLTASESESNNKPIVRNAETCAIRDTVNPYNWRRTDDSNIVGPSVMPQPSSSRWSRTNNHNEEWRTPPPSVPTSCRSTFQRNHEWTEPPPPSVPSSCRSTFKRNHEWTEPPPPSVPSSCRSTFQRNHEWTEPPPPSVPSSCISTFQRNHEWTEPPPHPSKRARIAHPTYNERQREPIRPYGSKWSNNPPYMQQCRRMNFNFPQMEFRGRSNSHTDDNSSNSLGHPRTYCSPHEIGHPRQPYSSHIPDNDHRRHNTRWRSQSPLSAPGVDRPTSSYRRA